MGASCCDDDSEFGDEKDETGGEDAEADGRGPGEAEVFAPIENDEGEAAEEQDRACPSPEACGDFAVAFVLGTANLADGLVGETTMVVDAATESGDECDLVGCVLFGFGQGAEDGAVGPAGGLAIVMV